MVFGRSNTEGLRCAIFEWVDNGDTKVREIVFVASRYGEAMNASSGSYHSVLGQSIRTTYHQPGILAKARRIHGQDLRSALQVRSPNFNFIRFHWILFTRQLHAFLNFSERYCREETLTQSQTL